MAIGDTILQPIPAVSTPGTLYASQLVDFLREIKARLEAKVPFSSLLASTFDMDNNALENAQYVGLYEQTDTSSEPVGSVFNYQGNLWYMHEDGAAQITLGASLNSAAIAGIGGDYGGANPASLYFVDADETYYFYDNFGTGDLARLAARSIDIYNATEAERVRIAYGGTTDWTLTLPAAVPVAQMLLQMDTSGNVLAVNTGLQALTLDANQNITIAGTGEIKHGDRVKILSAYPFATASGTAPTAGSGGRLAWSASATVNIPLMNYFHVGDRIKTIEFVNVGGTSATYQTVDLNGTIITFTSSSAAAVTLTITYTIVTSPSLSLQIAANTPYSLLYMRVTYDRP